MTKKRPAQDRKTAKKPASAKAKPDHTMAFAEGFLKQWQNQWQEMLQKGGMPNMDAMNQQNGFIPLQQIGPMGLMAPMGAVALANLKLLQELQDRVKMLEAQLAPAAKAPPKKKK